MEKRVVVVGRESRGKESGDRVMQSLTFPPRRMRTGDIPPSRYQIQMVCNCLNPLPTNGLVSQSFAASPLHLPNSVQLNPYTVFIHHSIFGRKEAKSADERIQTRPTRPCNVAQDLARRRWGLKYSHPTSEDGPILLRQFNIRSGSRSKRDDHEGIIE